MTWDSRAWIRGLIVCIVAGWFVADAGATLAAERTPIPEYTGERVYVKDVPDTFRSLPKAIKELERRSPQSYFAVVIRSVGPSGDAPQYVDELFNTWSEQARARNLALDPERSVIVLVAIDDRKAAVHTGRSLRERFGLDRRTVAGQIGLVFAPLARDQKYSEGIAALLASLNNTVAGKDPNTARIATGSELFPSPPVALAATPPQAGPSPKAETRSSPTPTAPAREASSTGTLIGAILASLAAIGLIVGILIWLARRRTRNSVEGKIKEFKKKAVDVMDHLDALKSRLMGLPIEDPDFKEPMSGETLAMYEQTQTQLTGLWDRWLEVMDIIDKAQSLAKKDSALGMEKLKEAEKLVSDSKVFEQIEEQSRAVTGSLDRLNQAHETARTAADKVVEEQKEITARIHKVDKEGLPTVPYKPEVDGIAAQADQAREVLTPDPIGANKTLDEARERAVKLRDRVGQILERFAEGRKITAELAALGERVGEYRGQGFRLDEEGGNPDHPGAQTFQRLEALRQAVHEGDPERAFQALNEAQETLKQSHQTLDSVLEAREYCAKDQPERVRETRRLREAMAQYEAFEAELRRDFAPSSWQSVSGHLDQARKLLETFDRKTDEAAAAASPTEQKYLLGSRLLHQVGQEQQVVFQLMSGLADQLNVLRSIREECQEAAHGLEDRAQATARYLSQNKDAIGSVARGSLQSAEQNNRQVESLLRDRQPDWPRIRQVLARTFEEYEIAQNQAEADVQVYQQLSGEHEKTRREAARVQAFLAGHEEDRLAANQHYRNAENALARVDSESRGSGGEWARLLEMVRGAAADLQRSEQLAREDIRLALQAESEIEEAARTVRKARAYFSMGVTLGTMNAEATVGEAQRLYQGQNYEQAIRTAAGAIQQMRQAYADAAQQVFVRQMQIDAGRRRSASMGGMFGVAGTAAAAAAASRAVASESRTDGDSKVASASGSWSSESAEGSW